jgi:cysteate synthase
LKLDGWQLEGGAHNIARRDGIGSLIIDAWNEIGRIPDHYFQGVGGGPGPIGVYEMMQRLIDFGLDEGPLAKIHLSQNPEHCPIHKAWQDGRSALQDSDFPEGYVEVYSDYLLSASPAYGVKGGVYDTLKSTNGETYVVERQDAIDAGKLFEETEGIDIMTPAEVALGSLIQAIEEEKVNKDDCIVLNISGGGVKRLQKERGTIVVEPWMKGPKENIADLVISSLQS